MAAVGLTGRAGYAKMFLTTTISNKQKKGGMTQDKDNPRVVLNLTTEERRKMWNTLRNHYSSIFNNSDILLDLVEKKYLQIMEGRTKTQIGEETLNIVKKILTIISDNNHKAQNGVDALVTSKGEYSGCDNPPGSE